MNHKTTPEHFEIFQEEFKKWMPTLDLYGWEVHFWHEPDKDDRAWVVWDREARIASVCLAKTWKDIEPTEAAIRSTARHEALELLLCKLKNMARSRTFSEVELTDEAHRVIRVLEKLLVREG